MGNYMQINIYYFYVGYQHLGILAEKFPIEITFTFHKVKLIEIFVV